MAEQHGNKWKKNFEWVAKKIEQESHKVVLTEQIVILKL